MLSIALTCFLQTKNNNYFSPKRRKKEKKEEKKDMRFQQPCSGGCQGFWKKNTTRSEAQVWRFFFQNPQGQPLLPVSEMAIFAYPFFRGQKEYPQKY